MEDEDEEERSSSPARGAREGVELEETSVFELDKEAGAEVGVSAMDDEGGNAEDEESSTAEDELASDEDVFKSDQMSPAKLAAAAREMRRAMRIT